MFKSLKALGKWWVQILVFVVVTTLVFAGLEIFIFPRSYQAGVQMYVRTGGNGTQYSQLYTDLQASGILVTDYMSISTSEIILKEVTENLRENYPQINDPSVLSVEKNIKVEAVNQTRIFWIYVSSSQPELSAAVANEIARTMMEMDLEITGFENLYILTEAHAPTESTFPKYIRDIPICAAAALLLAIAAVLFIDYWEGEKKRNEEEKRRLEETDKKEDQEAGGIPEPGEKLVLPHPVSATGSVYPPPIQTARISVSTSEVPAAPIVPPAAAEPEISRRTQPFSVKTVQDRINAVEDTARQPFTPPPTVARMQAEEPWSEKPYAHPKQERPGVQAEAPAEPRTPSFTNEMVHREEALSRHASSPKAPTYNSLLFSLQAQEAEPQASKKKTDADKELFSGQVETPYTQNQQKTFVAGAEDVYGKKSGQNYRREEIYNASPSILENDNIEDSLFSPYYVPSPSSSTGLAPAGSVLQPPSDMRQRYDAEKTARPYRQEPQNIMQGTDNKHSEQFSAEAQAAEPDYKKNIFEADQSREKALHPKFGKQR